MMVCQEFIDSYTEYMDGLLDDDDYARVEKHLADCDSCRRYKRVLTRGLSLWRGLPVAVTSPDFRPRLQHRLYHVEEEGKLSDRQRAGKAALAAVALVGLVAMAWIPFAARMSYEVELPAVVVQAPPAVVAERQPSLFDPGPYMPDAGFLLPLNATLDEVGGLFTTNYAFIRADSAQSPVIRNAGQIDESR
jgi:anti-sigma factor RsiW